MSGTHANKTESTQEPQGVKTMGEAAPQFVDNRASTTAQLVMQQFMHNSPRATAQHAAINAMSASAVQQQKIIQRMEPEEELQLKAIPQTAQLADMDEEELLQGKFETAQRVEEEELLQGKFEPAQRAEKPNNTGLPDNLKSGIENLSGMSMDHVKVHYNSDKPAQLQAYAYAQGSEIHVAPGQEKHLPHEAWHVVQQAQGRVKPTVQMKGGVPVNDDVGLETEADVMGANALGLGEKSSGELMPMSLKGNSILQRMIDVSTFTLEDFVSVKDVNLLRDYISYGLLGEKTIFINNRAQTFKQAVNEFIKTKSLGHREVQDIWSGLMAIKDVDLVKAQMKNIADVINEVKSENPDHPNAAWSAEGLHSGSAVGHESAGTIPQTPESRQISTAIWNELDANGGEMRKAFLTGQLGHDSKQKTNFMIGVLVLPNKEIIVGVSGQLNQLKPFGELCKEIVSSRGFRLKAVVDTKSLPEASITHYKTNFEVVRGEPAKDFTKEGGDLGNKPGSCAAAVLLGSKEAYKPESFAALSGEGGREARLGLTEVFTGKTALISNRLEPDEEAQRWPRADDSGEYDVPSCETCQHQLDLFALNLVILDRQMKLETHYPRQIEKLTLQLGDFEKDLEVQIKNTDKHKTILAEQELHLKKMDIDKAAWDKAFDKEKIPTLIKRNQLDGETSALEKSQKFSDGKNEQIKSLIENYRDSKKSENTTGKAPGHWWSELEKKSSSLKGLSMDKRAAALNEYEKTLGSSSGEETPEVKKLKLEISQLEEQMKEFDKKRKEFDLLYTQAKEEYRNNEKAFVMLSNKIEHIKLTMQKTKEKLARYPFKIKREKTALGLLDQKREKFVHHSH
jgi:hypothetical protein